jgi:hypothetical protein
MPTEEIDTQTTTKPTDCVSGTFAADHASHSAASAMGADHEPGFAQCAQANPERADAMKTRTCDPTQPVDRGGKGPSRSGFGTLWEWA